MHAYILIKIRPGEIQEAVDQMRQVKGVTEAQATFGPYDAVAVIEAADLTSIGRLVAMEVQSVPGVMETLTCLAMGI